jgi:hypothetical protein
MPTRSRLIKGRALGAVMLTMLLAVDASYHYIQKANREWRVEKGIDADNPQPRSEEWVRGLFPFAAQGDNQLSFDAGDEIKIVPGCAVHAAPQSDWLMGELNGKQGTIPRNYVQPFNKSDAAEPTLVQSYPLFHCIWLIIHAAATADAMWLALSGSNICIKSLAAIIALASSSRLVYIYAGFGAVANANIVVRSIVSTLPFSGQWLYHLSLSALFERWSKTLTYKPPQPCMSWIAPLFWEHLRASGTVFSMFMSMELVPNWVVTIGAIGTCYTSLLFYYQSCVHQKSISILSKKFELDHWLDGGVMAPAVVTALPRCLLAQSLINFWSFFARGYFFSGFVVFQSTYYAAEIGPGLLMLAAISRGFWHRSRVAAGMRRGAGAGAA